MDADLNEATRDAADAMAVVRHRQERRALLLPGSDEELETKWLALLSGFPEEIIDDWKQGDGPEGEAGSRIAEMDRLRASLSAILQPSAILPWLTAENAGLGGVTPLEILRRGEAERLWALVDALESGLPI